jgi:hypothetical protein
LTAAPLDLQDTGCLQTGIKRPRVTIVSGSVSKIAICVLALLSLMVSSVAACSCAHHHDTEAIETDSCHHHPDAGPSVGEKEIEAPCVCLLNAPVPAIVFRSGIEITPFEHAAVSPDQSLISFEPIFLAGSALDNSQSPTTFLSKRRYASMPSRAPPRL